MMVRIASSNPRQGFTLIELMIALTIGALVIASIYTIGGASSRYFQEQHRLAQTQMGLRVAAELLRRDITRAGFLSLPNSRRADMCVTPARHIQAIEFFDNETTAVPNAIENGVTTDRIRLVGNFATADRYQGQLNLAGDRINFDVSKQGFRRSFLNVTTLSVDATVYDQTFRPGRLLHLINDAGTSFLVTIVSRDAASASVIFTPALPVGMSASCLSGFGGGLYAAPLSRIEYFVGNLGGVMTPTAAQVTGAPTQLIRRELEFDAVGTPIVGTERVVVEHAVDFNFSFVLDQQVTLGAPPIFARLSGATAQSVLNDVNTNVASVPHRIRSVFLSLSVRTPDQDPTFPFVARSSTDPLTRFRADPAQRGASRVRTLTTEIFVPNIAAAGVRP